MACLSLSLTLSLIGCVGNSPPRPASFINDAPFPTISEHYAALLKQGSEEVEREALKHEYDWQAWAQKVEGR
jgi:hypothetical protein